MSLKVRLFYDTCVTSPMIHFRTQVLMSELQFIEMGGDVRLSLQERAAATASPAVRT